MRFRRRIIWRDRKRIQVLTSELIISAQVSCQFFFSMEGIKLHANETHFTLIIHLIRFGHLINSCLYNKPLNKKFNHFSGKPINTNRYRSFIL